jgi:hypothetical protein
MRKSAPRLKKNMAVLFSKFVITNKEKFQVVYVGIYKVCVFLFPQSSRTFYFPVSDVLQWDGATTTGRCVGLRHNNSCLHYQLFINLTSWKLMLRPPLHDDVWETYRSTSRHWTKTCKFHCPSIFIMSIALGSQNLTTCEASPCLLWLHFHGPSNM